MTTDKKTFSRREKLKNLTYFEVFAHLCKLAICMNVALSWPLRKLNLQANPWTYFILLNNFDVFYLLRVDKGLFTKHKEQKSWLHKYVKSHESINQSIAWVITWLYDSS